MSDFLLELSKNPRARALVSALGLPIPLPQPLKRDLGPWRRDRWPTRASRSARPPAPSS